MIPPVEAARQHRRFPLPELEAGEPVGPECEGYRTAVERCLPPSEAAGANYPENSPAEQSTGTVQDAVQEAEIVLPLEPGAAAYSAFHR